MLSRSRHWSIKIQEVDDLERSKYAVFFAYHHRNVLCRRTQFTDDDEANLARWIAAKIPFKQTGGRTGNRVYQLLCEMVSMVKYAFIATNYGLYRSQIPSTPGLADILGNPGVNATKRIPRVSMR